MKFVSGMLFGIILCAGTWTLQAQPGRAVHPRLAAAVRALRDAKAYMEAAPHDFGGHKSDAVRACDEAIRQIRLAMAYRAR
jgi:hypothetical protein